MNIVVVVLTLAAASYASAYQIGVKVPNGEVIPNSYIVVLRPNTDKINHLKGLSKVLSQYTNEPNYVTNNYSHVLHGYSATLSSAALQHVLSSPDVEYVEADGVVSVNSQFGLPPIQHARKSKFRARASGGAGVVVYSLDTGIDTQQACFGGRASWGATFGGYQNADGNGHGTKIASIAVCTTYGVATSANVVAVKVLSDGGSGSVSDVISGVNYAYSTFLSSGKPSLALMTFGGSASSAFSTAVSAAVAGGLHCTIGAGDSSIDASQNLIGLQSAIIVGALNGNDKAPFSNYGSIVGTYIWGPGANVPAVGGAFLSGTSPATAYVTGVLAIVLGEYGNVSPAYLTAEMQIHAQVTPSGLLKIAIW